MTRPVADQMVETLAAPGVEHFYGIVGDSLNGFTDALRRLGGFELSALIEALVQRAVDSPETKLHVGPLELDLIERTAKRGDRSVDLLPREFRLLEYMMRHKGRVLTREMLLREVWKYKFVPKTNLVDVHMGRLRRKIDGPHEPPMILNVRGKGFILRSEDGQSASEQAR
jgi:DNA-binding response OmpR family regulator